MILNYTGLSFSPQAAENICVGLCKQQILQNKEVKNQPIAVLLITIF